MTFSLKKLKFLVTIGPVLGGRSRHEQLSAENNHIYIIIYIERRCGQEADPISWKNMVGAAGLEPATTCLEGRCSIHLSYAPLYGLSSF